MLSKLSLNLLNVYISNEKGVMVDLLILDKIKVNTISLQSEL